MPNDPFIDIAALSSLGPVRYLDARDQAAFDAGHAPGAVRAPVEIWDAAAKAADTGFEKTSYWDKALGALGVDQSTVAVTYDSGRMTDAARVWFILQDFGIKTLILNGGWPILSSATALPPGAEASKGDFRAVPEQGPWVWLIGRRSSGNSTATRTCLTCGRVRSSPARTCASAPVAAIYRVRVIYRTSICWTMASFVRRPRCAPCWKASGSARAITS